MSDQYRYIGKAVPRRDAVDLVTGRAQFVNDIQLPGMLYGKVLRSPHAHANIVSINVDKAKDLPGVKAVLTYKDIPDWRVGNPPHLRVLDSKVRFVGDAVALVAAEREDIALEALDLIDVDYEPLKAVFDIEDAIAPGAPQLYDVFPNNTVPPVAPWLGPKTLQSINTGDVDRGFAEADVVVEGSCAYENIPNPLPPEPPGAVAQWTSPNSVNVWISSQGPYFDRLILYYTLGRKVNVNVIACQCGASYGSKGTSFPVILYAIVLAKAAGRPVKLCLSKKEHLSVFTLRLGSRVNARVGMKKDGTVTAVSGEWLVNTGCYSAVTQLQVAVAFGEAQLFIRCDNWDMKSKIVCTNRTASGWIRGFGGQELSAALIPIVTQALEKIDMDPLEFYKKNFIKAGQTFWWRDGEQYTSRVVDFTRAMDKGAEVFGWKDRWRGWLKPTSVMGNKRTGVGVGVLGNADVGEDVAEAFVRLDPTHKAMVYLSICEQGTGQRSSLCKMAAEVLKLPLESVSIVPNDPSLSPYEFGSVGSRGTYAIGSAVINAAEDAKRRLFEMAAEKLGADPDNLETADGYIFIKGQQDRKVSWREAMGVTRTIIGYGRFEPDFSLCNCLMTFVEVEVDVETGIVKLIRVVNATDVGQIIDPLCLNNQLHAVLGAAGADTAVFEETVLDHHSGRIVNCNMLDYKWRTFEGLPQMQNVILETPFPSHQFKAIGVSEIVTATGVTAVAMAVSNAIGKRLYTYPLTPDKVLKALGKVGNRT